MGFASGQNRRATLSLITTTRGDPMRSPALNARPARMGVPRAEKYSSEAVWYVALATLFSSVGRPTTRSGTE